MTQVGLVRRARRARALVELDRAAHSAGNHRAPELSKNGRLELENQRRGGSQMHVQTELFEVLKARDSARMRGDGSDVEEHVRRRCE